VNSKKTEAVYFSKLSKRLVLKCQDKNITTGARMKVLGLYFDEKMSWPPQIRSIINNISIWA